MNCRHRKTWLIASGHYEWCYECGALRHMAVTPPNHCRPAGRWAKPVGRDGENPYKVFAKLPINR